VESTAAVLVRPQTTIVPAPQSGGGHLEVEVVFGDLLDQKVDAIVNAWNRNVIPWWLLIPQGVSGAIKKRAGTGPFRELARVGPIPLGGAVVTSAGRLPHRAIIHVAAINLLWRSSGRSIRRSVARALSLAKENDLRSVAFPVLGSGSGGFEEEEAARIIEDELSSQEFDGRVVLVRYRAQT
jgi:O-acetyl-ADP-ribose deacetylase (regulator of RNase III)